VFTSPICSAPLPWGENQTTPCSGKEVVLFTHYGDLVLEMHRMYRKFSLKNVWSESKAYSQLGYIEKSL
jgi:hypothetical protein